MNSNIDLVEYIQQKVGCRAMCEVRGKVTIAQMREWYKALNPDDYTLDMWNDAIWYTLNDTSKTNYFKSIDEVKACLE